MRKLAIQVLLAATLCAGLALTAQAADDGDKPSGLSAWWNGLFGGKEKSGDTTTKADKKKTELGDKPPLAAADRARLMRREKEAYFRRVAVCDRLREVANQKNDPDLERRIDETLADAFQVYQQHTAALDQDASDDEPASKNDKTKANGTNAGRDKRNIEEDDQ